MGSRPPADRQSLAGLAAFLEQRGDEAGAILWNGALTWLEQAAAGAREGTWARWSHYPAGELRRLRRELAAALSLARLAVAFQESENERSRDLTADLQARAEEAGRKRRRQQTREAERVRLLNARCRREGREPTSQERYPDLYDEDGRRKP